MIFNNYKSEINEYLDAYFKNRGTYEKVVYESMNYSVAIGGKRVRPILMLLTYKMFHENYGEAIPFAAALEMIHTYSLIHDDLPCMDDDDLRRGKPTNHKVYGEALAVLAGDGLLNEAFNVMLTTSLDGDINKIKAAQYIGQCSGADGMIGGQVVDITSENKVISQDALQFMHRKKTGALIKAAVVGGALLAGTDNKTIKLLDEYAEKLGLAFQVKDDILDVLGDEEKVGKTLKSDDENNKSTYVSLYGIEKCKEIAVNLTNDCYDILNKLDKNTEEMRKMTKFLLERDY